jgi:hypothetical protein
MRIALLLASLCVPAWAGITLDTATSSANTSTGTTITWSHTCSGPNRLLFVGFGFRGDAAITLSGITYNGVALTKIRSDSSGPSVSEIWYLVAPPTGAHSIVVTLAADISSQFGRGGAGAISFNGVDQTNPLDSQAGRIVVTSANQSVDITTVANGAVAASNIFCNEAFAYPSATGPNGAGDDYLVFMDFFLLAGDHAGPWSPELNTFPWLTDFGPTDCWVSVAAFKPVASLAPANVLGALGGANVAH